jgi:hypothetical protein
MTKMDRRTRQSRGKGPGVRTKRLVAGVAIVGGVGLHLVGLGAMIVNADASPPVVSNGPDPSGPTVAVEPAPSAPSPASSSGTGSASTGSGSSMPNGSPPDLSVGGSSAAPIHDAPSGPAPIAGPTSPGGPPDQGVVAPSDLPRIPGGPPPIAGPTGPAAPAPHAPGGTPPNAAPGDPIGPSADLAHPCRPLWCPRPPDQPNQPPLWPDQFWPDTSDTSEPTTVLSSPCVAPPPLDAPPPPPFQYGGQTVSPAFDGGLQQWGFSYLGNWVPLFGPECRMQPTPEG